MPTMNLATMMISKDLAISLTPIITAGTMEKMLLKRRVPFLSQVWADFKARPGVMSWSTLNVSGYLPSLLTRGATIREPKKPPSGYMATDRDQSRLCMLYSMLRP